jgi:hypothetical protein
VGVAVARIRAAGRVRAVGVGRGVAAPSASGRLHGIRVIGLGLHVVQQNRRVPSKRCSGRTAR